MVGGGPLQQLSALECKVRTNEINVRRQYSGWKFPAPGMDLGFAPIKANLVSTLAECLRWRIGCMLTKKNHRLHVVLLSLFSGSSSSS